MHRGYSSAMRTLHPLEQLLSPKSRDVRIAVVGASNDPSKYGNIICRNLAAHGYTVLPVHPTESEIAGLPAVPRVADLAPPVTVVNVVTPPAVSRRIVAECAASGHDRLWFQPGSFDDATLATARAARTPDGRELAVEDEACIMVVAARVPRL